MLSEEIKVGRGIASLRIHIERAIGRIKQFRILQGTFPLSMIRLFNQVVCVCAWVTNFHPALIAPPAELSDEDDDEVLSYLHSLEDCGSEDYDSDSD